MRVLLAATSLLAITTVNAWNPSSIRNAKSIAAGAFLGLGIMSNPSLKNHGSFFGIPIAHAEGGKYDDFSKTESGLKYKDTVVGDGKLPSPGDTVRVHYTGWLDDFESEKKFDSSYDRRSPLTFKVGTKQVISGWDEALLTDMKVGTTRQVVIPSDLAYGKRGAGGVIPPDATLYFTMELIGLGAR